MSTAAVNGDKGMAAGNGKQQLRSSSSGKALDGARKQAPSPVDGQTNRRQSSQPPKAWTGTNPITQRSSNSPNMPNGSEKPLPRLPQQTQPKTGSHAHADKHAHDRLLYLLAHCTGIDATITLKNGEQFTGVFSGTSIESPAKSTYILKMARRTRLPSHQQTNGNTELAEEYVGEGQDHVMTFDVQDTVDFAVSGVVTASAQATQNGTAASSFRTDTEISGRDPNRPRERELQRWDGGMDMSLEDMALESSGKGTSWDQFAVNEQTFGTSTTYNEDEYTTSIDRSHPEYKRREAQAARLAREIEGSAPANAHVAEERRQNAERDDGLDEEEKYSGVRRDITPLAHGAAGSYVPPSRRPLTNRPTVPGAPFDPAIISLAKPAPGSAGQAAASTDKPAESGKLPEISIKTEEPRPEDNKSTTTDVPAPIPQIPALKKTESTTEDHVRGTADAFKQFANNEKLRLRQVQEQKRVHARAEKNVKLNDLKKFAENFKLKSRVPDDLVPILAKDHEKQQEIKRKAEESARIDEQRRKEREAAGEKATPSPSKASTSASAAQATAAPLSVDPRAQPVPQHGRNRMSQNTRGAPTLPSPRAPYSQRQGQPYMGRAPAQQPPLTTNFPPSVPTGPNSGREASTLSPTSATNARLNVNAKEFKFQPGASNFTPTGSSPSPRRIPAAAPPVEESNASFFGSKEPKSKGTMMDVNNDCDTIRRLKDSEYPAEKKKQNGGIPPSFHTPPTWPTVQDKVNVSYKDAFPKTPAVSQGTSPMHTPGPAAGPMSHQLPQQMQGPHLATPGQQQRFYQPPPHGPHHGPAQGFDPRMQQLGGPGGSVQNSPRYAQAQMAGFNPQMAPMQMPQMPQMAGQSMQPYGMSPGMAYRQMQMPTNGPQMMMMPGQPPQHSKPPPTLRRQFSGRGHYQQHSSSYNTDNSQVNPMRPSPYQQHVPSFPGGPNMPQMGGQMMVQNPSQGGFVPNGMPPQQPPYGSPMPPHAQPQHHGYAASPRPGPHMMQQSGSHQGFQPQHMHFAPSPHGQPQPPHPHFLQQRHSSSGGGGGGGGGFHPQMTPRGQQAMPQMAGGGHVPSPGMGGPQGQGMGDEGK